MLYSRWPAGECFWGYQPSSFTLAVSKPQNLFPSEKICQGEDGSLINHILSVSPLDNTRKCVHGLLLHQAAAVVHSTSTSAGRAEKPRLTAEMGRRPWFPYESFPRGISPTIFPQMEICPVVPQEACPPFSFQSRRCLCWSQVLKVCVVKGVFLEVGGSGSCHLAGGLAGHQSLSGAVTPSPHQILLLDTGELLMNFFAVIGLFA